MYYETVQPNDDIGHQWTQWQSVWRPRFPKGASLTPAATVAYLLSEKQTEMIYAYEVTTIKKNVVFSEGYRPCGLICYCLIGYLFS